MGYSCTRAADDALKEMVILLKERSQYSHNASNQWDMNGANYFYEIGKEQPDGAITGTVHKIVGDRARRVGSFRIESNGIVTRFPTSTKYQRRSAMMKARND